MGVDERKFGDKEKDKQPGPGQYTPQKPMKKTESWKIGSDTRRGLENHASVPGPGKYMPDPLKQNSQKANATIWSFGGEAQRPGSLPKSMQNNFVSPHTYNGDKSRRNGHMAIFGKDRRSDVCNQTATDRKVGPGAYDTDQSDVGKNKEKSRGFSIPCRNKSVDCGRSPGPGQYETNRTITNIDKNVQKACIGKAKRNSLNDKNFPNLGPGKYEPHGSTLDNHFGKFGRDERKNNIKDNDKVGPGKYLWDKAPKIKLPEYSIGASTRKPMEAGPRFVPGPGKYDSSAFNKQSDHTSSPKFSIGKDNRKDAVTLKNLITKVPGPGQYELRTDVGNSEAKYSIGREKRKTETELKFKTPGPGNYDYKPSCFDSPNK